MNETLEKLLKATREPARLAGDLGKAGLSSIESFLDGNKILGSLSVYLGDKDSERDETHYFLIPVRHEDYVVFSKRVLPEGVGALNSLPRARVFHVPDPRGVEFLERWMFDQKRSEEMRETGSDLAEKLEAFAESVDEESKNVSGGLLLIGGAVAFSNPLAGAALAASSLLPSVSSSALKNGMELAGTKLRKAAQKKEDKRTEKVAKAEVRKLKPEILPNPILESIDLCFSREEKDYDPFLQDMDLILSWEDEIRRRLTLEAVREVFSHEYKPSDRRFWKSLPGRWIQHIGELSEVR